MEKNKKTLWVNDGISPVISKFKLIPHFHIGKTSSEKISSFVSAGRGAVRKTSLKKECNGSDRLGCILYIYVHTS
jgi:hypothetical protein